MGRTLIFNDVDSGVLNTVAQQQQQMGQRKAVLAILLLLSLLTLVSVARMSERWQDFHSVHHLGTSPKPSKITAVPSSTTTTTSSSDGDMSEPMSVLHNEAQRRGPATTRLSVREKAPLAVPTLFGSDASSDSALVVSAARVFSALESWTFEGDWVQNNLTNLMAISSSSSSSCAAAEFSAKPVKRDYNHRRKRKNELYPMEFWRVISQEAPKLVALAPAIPRVLNDPPVSFSPHFNISDKFGSWKAAFFPVPTTTASVDSSASSLAVASLDALRHFASPQLIVAEPPLYVALFGPSVLYHGHLVTCSTPTTVYTSGGCLWEFPFNPGSTAAPHSGILTKAEQRAVPIGVPLCDYWCRGYYHFTHEHLPRVGPVHALLLRDPRAYLVLSHKPNGFQMDFFHDILGIPKDRIVHGPAKARVAAAYPMPLKCGNTFTHMLSMIRNIVHSRLHLSPPPIDTTTATTTTTTTAPKDKNDEQEEGGKVSGKKKSSKLHIIRVLFAERKHKSRMASNYDQIKAHVSEWMHSKDRWLREHRVVFLMNTTHGDTNARTQVKLFYDSDLVIGPHGANIANMMWMRRGSHVIEVASRSKGNMCYYTTATRIGLVHHLLLHGKGKDATYELDPGELKKHVEYAVEEILKLRHSTY